MPSRNIQRFIRRAAKQVLSILLWRTRNYELLGKIDPRARNDIIQFTTAIRDNFNGSKAQLMQDIWVLFQTRFRREGYFVEFGATDGRSLSNTWYLEKSFGWKGILAEPNPAWHAELRQNRPSAEIDTRAVYTRSGDKVSFLAGDLQEIGSLEKYAQRDFHAHRRAGTASIEVETISLCDLLKEHAAPEHIDYMSIDTEGGEYEILRAFDFSQHTVGLISVEHNFTPAREKIFSLLTALGYIRKFEEFSQFDDWYALEPPARANRARDAH
jgi:FkbM family methyltransferase